MPPISALILAAGKGIRMKSSLPKVLHPLGGKPLVERVFRNLSALKIKKMNVVIGHGGDGVRSTLLAINPKLTFSVQRKVDGSGGAVRQALAWVKKCRGDIVVACGDAPLIAPETLKVLIKTHQREKNKGTVLSSLLENPKGYGRIKRNADGSVAKIVEELDASLFEKKIKEVNTGTYIFNARMLAWALPRLTNKNAKREFYLTDVLEIFNQRGLRVGAVVAKDYRETLGINSRQDLALAEALYYQRKNEELMLSGVRLMDPKSTFIDDEVPIGPDTVIWPQTFIMGASKVGSGCEIGPWTFIKDTVVKNNAKIQSSFTDSAIIEEGAQVGPFSRVRPKSVVGPGAHLGNFSEVKNAKLGPGVKVNHLSYLGDAKVGKNVNIGAGTITCNYDGYRKYPTLIEEHAFIGSNTNLIAPIKVGSHAVVGAGSSLSKNVPAWSLALERGARVVKKGWAKKRSKKKGKK